jgi:nitronate monooxygenase
VGTTGNQEAMALYAGQSCGLVSSIEPAGTIVRRIAEEATEALERCAGLVQAGDEVA